MAQDPAMLANESSSRSDSSVANADDDRPSSASAHTIVESTPVETTNATKASTDQTNDVPQSTADESIALKPSTDRGPASAAPVSEAPHVELSTHHKSGLVDQTTYLPPKSIIIVLLAMQLAVFLAFLDQSIVATALPNISAAFNEGRSSSWVASAYLLTSTAFQPLWGRSSDIFGRKYALLACVLVFLLGSLACALAQSMIQLIVFRGIQGAGGGGLLTLVLIIISDIVSLRERGKYQGVTEATIAIANGVGPLLGGVLSEKVNWRWCFWINLPIGGAALVSIMFFLPLKGVRNSIRKKLSQIDYLGAGLTLAATVLLLLPINWGGTSFPWSSSVVIGCLVGAGVAFIIFFVWKSRARIPIVPPSIFRVQTVACILYNTFISGATILTQLFYIPQYLQFVRGASAIRSGVLILPLLLVTTAAVFVAGQLVARTGEYKYFIVGGYAVWAVSLGLQSTLNADTSTAKLVGFLVLTGFGQGQTLQTSMVAAQAAVERDKMSVVTSTRVFMRSLGGTVFLAVAAAIINNSLRHDLLPLDFSSETISAIIDDPTAIWRPSARNGSTLFDLPQDRKTDIIDAYVKGFRTLFLVFAALQSLNCVLATLFIKRINLRRDDEAALKERGRALIEAKKAKKKQKASAATASGKGDASASPDLDLEKGPPSEK